MLASLWLASWFCWSWLGSLRQVWGFRWDNWADSAPLDSSLILHAPAWVCSHGEGKGARDWKPKCKGFIKLPLVSGLLLSCSSSQSRFSVEMLMIQRGIKQFNSTRYEILNISYMNYYCRNVSLKLWESLHF